jgi:hypothetical protein
LHRTLLLECHQGILEAPSVAANPGGPASWNLPTDDDNRQRP